MPQTEIHIPEIVIDLDAHKAKNDFPAESVITGSMSILALIFFVAIRTNQENRSKALSQWRLPSTNPTQTLPKQETSVRIESTLHTSDAGFPSWFHNEMCVWEHTYIEECDVDGVSATTWYGVFAGTKASPIYLGNTDIQTNLDTIHLRRNAPYFQNTSHAKYMVGDIGKLSPAQRDRMYTLTHPKKPSGIGRYYVYTLQHGAYINCIGKCIDNTFYIENESLATISREDIEKTNTHFQEKHTKFAWIFLVVCVVCASISILTYH